MSHQAWANFSMQEFHAAGQRRNWLANYRASFLVMKVQESGIEQWSSSSSASASRPVISLQAHERSPAAPIVAGEPSCPAGNSPRLKANDPLVPTIGRQNRMLAKSNFLKLLKLIWVIQSVLEKYSAFHFSQISGFFAPSRLDTRGVSRSSRTWRRGAVDATRHETNDVAPPSPTL
jgi:hypothetical protein